MKDSGDRDNQDSAITIIQDGLERRFQDLKKRNQKLIEHLQTKEDEHKLEHKKISDKLRESKDTIRKLEDENLSLKFQLASVKTKEETNQKTIKELQRLLDKYYKKCQLYEKERTNESYLDSNQLLKVPSADSIQTDNGPSRDRKKSFTLIVHNSTSMMKDDEINPPMIQRPEINIKYATTDIKGGIKPQFDESPILVSKRLSDYLETEHSRGETNSFKINSGNGFTSSRPEDGEINTEAGSPLDFRKSRSSNETTMPKRFSLIKVPGDVSQMKNLTKNIPILGFEINVVDGDTKTEGDFTPSPMPLFSPTTKKPQYLQYIKTFRETEPDISLFEVKENRRNLFEDFVIIGLDKSDILKYTQENPEAMSGVLKPKILFNYPSDEKMRNETPHNSLPDFTFPFGCEFQRLKSSPSMSSLNPIVITPNDYEQKLKCFIFPILSPNPPNVTSPGPAIEACNPHHLIYVVCISFKDFINTTDDTKKKKSHKDIKYWEVNYVMCFMTYFPFINLFFDIMIHFLNIIKVQRMIKRTDSNEEDFPYFDMDYNFSLNFYETIGKKNLKTILQLNVPKFSEKLEFYLQANIDYKIAYELESKEHADTLECLWGAHLVFSYVPLKDLIFFFSSVLLERRMVFLSKNIHLLTAILSLMRVLIKPFRYIFPMIFNLPEVLMELCDAPGATLIGINKNEEFLLNSGLLEEYPGCFFICLDECKSYIPKEDVIEVPSFDNFEKKLLHYYAMFNNNLDYKFVSPQKGKKHPTEMKQKLKLALTKEEKENCLQVIKIFKESLREKVIKLLPEKPVRKDDELDYAEMEKLVFKKVSDSDKKFMKLFLNTQLYTYFIEQHYGPKFSFK